MNLVLSHPDACMPRGELHEVFQGAAGEPLRVRLAKNLRYAPLRLLARRKILSIVDWTERAPLDPLSRLWLDRVLFDEKLRARSDAQNHLRAPGRPYRTSEIRDARLCCKLLDGLIFFAPELARMYPDASFVAVAREPVSLYESWSRRGIDLPSFVERYRAGIGRMVADAAQLPRYRIVRYEDLMRDPAGTLATVCQATGLPLDEIEHVRLETKPVIDAEGKHRFVHGTDALVVRWYPKDGFQAHLRPETSANQARRLPPEAIERVRRECAESRRALGYD
jgi:hypothetical protein